MSSETSPESTTFILKNIPPVQNKQKFIFKVQKHPEDLKRVESDKSTPYEKKLGRKQDNTKPISKRIEQNRIAQRAFRERRENYIKTLEDKVKDLEEAQLKSKVENEKLLSYLQSLEQNTNIPAQNNSSLATISESNTSTIEPLEISSNASYISFHNKQDNCSTPENYLSINSTDFSTHNHSLQQPLYDSVIPGYDSFNLTSNVSSSISNFQTEHISTGQQPTMNLVDDYMFPDATIVSSILPFQSTSMTDSLTSTSTGTFDSSFMPEGSLSYSTYFGLDYYPTSTTAVSQVPMNTVSSHLPTLLSSDVLATEASPLTDPLEIMNPYRPPPTPQEVYQLAVHHKMMTEKMKTVTYTIDDLCEAMRKKATCSAVHDYLTSYLGQDPLQYV